MWISPHCTASVFLRPSPVNIILRNHFATMVQVFDQMTEQEVLSTGEGPASVFLQTLHLVAGKKVEHPFEQSARLERICLHIEKHLSKPIGIDALCKHFAISRSGLYRLFEPLGGIAAVYPQPPRAAGEASVAHIVNV